MCGIAGEINFLNTKTDYEVFESMKNSLKYRGPNQDGILSVDEATLIHTRLAVVDIENGTQPMTFTKGKEIFHLVYNGELYNTSEIKNKLKNLGYNFVGHSDTEVLLKAYAQWGKDCLELLNGIFSFAIWEQHNKQLFFARDRLGVKPFFYSKINGSFMFASEIKTLLKHPMISSNIDANSVAEIILLGPGRTPGCAIFNDIKELRPGFYGKFDANELNIGRYWELTDTEHTDTFEQTLEKVRFLVTDSIERQLISDVPICTFLSGGLDSSLISSIASKKMRENGEVLNTFSVDYRYNDKYFASNKFQPDRDEHYIDFMSNYLGTNHTKILLDYKDVEKSLFESVQARDLPGMADVDSSLLLLCRQVKEKATVAISGESADEIFGGYPWYRDQNIKNNKGFPWNQQLKFRQAFLNKQFAIANLPLYIKEKYFCTLKSISKSEKLDKFKSMTKLNCDWFMQTLLERKDRMSMRSGLEVRVPFCDHRVAQYLYSVPWEMKNHKNIEKGLLREAVADLLPQKILWRKKNPYPITHNPEYLKSVSKSLAKVIADPQAPLLRILNKHAIERFLIEKNTTLWYGQLMGAAQTMAYFLQINYWLEKYKVNIL